MTQAVSMEEALKFGASRALGAKITSAARGAGVTVEEMRRRARDYEPGDGNSTRLPISDGDRPTAFSVDEPLVPVVVDGSGRPLGSVLTGSGAFKPTGNEAADAAMQVLAGADRVGPPVSKAVLEAAARAGLLPQAKAAAEANLPPGAPPDPLADIRRELEVERRVPAQPPQPKPDNSVLAQIWVKGTNFQTALRCQRAFIDRTSFLPMLVLVTFHESDVTELPVNRPLVVTLAAIARNDPPTMLQDALHMGFSFTDSQTREKYLCLVLPDPEEPEQQEPEPALYVENSGDPLARAGDLFPGFGEMDQ